MKQLGHLHRATGHGPYESLIKSLEARKVDKRILDLAREYRCSTCEERKKPSPRRLANLEVNTQRGKVIQFDAAWWSPASGDARNKCQFLVFVDEASRFAVGRVFRHDGGGHVKARDIINCFHELWETTFGLPELVRADPDGACRSRELDIHFQSLGVETENVPADAHWKVSVVERSIQWIKELMSKAASEFPNMSHEALLSQAIRTWNQREPVRGCSPFQWMLGRAPDTEDKLFTPDLHNLPGSLLQDPQSDFHRSEALRVLSEKAFVDWQYREKVSRARNAKPKNSRMYMPGDLVFFWRRQGQGLQGNNSGIRKGCYAGPARILAMETKHHGDQLLPGSSVWLVRGMRLVKVCVEQLHPASERETILHELSEKETSGPWTMTRLTEALGPHDYDDATTREVPVDADPDDVEVDMPAAAPFPEPSEAVRPEHRLRGKRPLEEVRERAGTRQRPALLTQEPEGPRRLPTEASWQESVPTCFWASEPSRHWEDERFAVEIALDLPESVHQVKKFIRDPMQYFVKSLRRKSVKISDKRLDPTEREKFRQAKDAEVQKYLSAKAIEALPAHLRPEKSQAMRMRWILTYKEGDLGEPKAKARAVILGFQDPGYAERPTFAPTMTRTSRQMILQFAAWKGFACWKGDVSGAFLQGRPYNRDLYVTPVPELCVKLGVPPESVCKVKKACYGLVEAPIEWFETVNSFLCEIGYKQMRSDPCTWIYNEGERVVSIISGHVDDFLFVGRSDCSLWLSLKEKIQQRFKWQEWEQDAFTQCGVSVSRLPDGSFELSQRQYLEGVAEIPLSRDRRRQRHEATTPEEKSQLRALLGALSWHVGQVG